MTLAGESPHVFLTAIETRSAAGNENRGRRGFLSRLSSGIRTPGSARCAFVRATAQRAGKG
jgi:hypothetical protein